MVEMIVDADSMPDWAKGYFREFQNWQRNLKNKELPDGFDSYIDLYVKHIGIEFNVESNLSKNKKKIESFTFRWKSERDRTFFLIKF
jgi:hypothetical protein